MRDKPPKCPAVCARIIDGELDSLFGQWLEYTINQFEFYFENWKVSYRPEDGLFNLQHETFLQRDIARPQPQFTSFEQVSLDNLLEYWNKPLELARCSKGPFAGDVYYAFDHGNARILRSRWSAWFVHQCSKLSIERVKLLTFGDPFVSEADRMTYMGELV